MFSIRFSNNKFQCWHVEHSVMKKYKAEYWWGKMKKRERRERGKKGKEEKKKGGKGKRKKEGEAVDFSIAFSIRICFCVLISVYVTFLIDSQ